MELKPYLRVLARRWWIIIPIFLIGLIGAEIFSLRQEPAYRASATYVVTLSAPLRASDGSSGAVDVLSRRTEIGATFATAVTSRRLRAEAAQALSLTPGQRDSLNVDAQLLPGTNVLEIQVTGASAALVAGYASALGDASIRFVESLYDAFTLQPLDEAQIPRNPIRPNFLLNVIIGGLFGLILGVGLAFLAEAMSPTPLDNARFSIIDAESGIFTDEYFMMRLREELARGHRSGRPVSVALLELNHLGSLDGADPRMQAHAVRLTGDVASSLLREEDLVARVGPTTLGFILPELGTDAAQQAMEVIRRRLTRSPIQLEEETQELYLRPAGAVVSADGVEAASPTVVMMLAEEALREAQTAAQGEVRATEATGDDVRSASTTVLGDSSQAAPASRGR